MSSPSQNNSSSSSKDTDGKNRAPPSEAPKKNSPRSPSPNPFTAFLSTSPGGGGGGGGGGALSGGASPRSPNDSFNNSMNSPRFQTEFANGMKIPTASMPIGGGRESGGGPMSAAQVSNAMLTAASPPRFASIDQLMSASNAVQNMALAHEISVNQNFKLEKSELPSDSIEKKIHDTVHKAFWNSLREDLSKEPADYKHALSIINDAKQGLIGLLLPNHVKFREQIESVLDMDLIKQQVGNGTFQFGEYAKFVVQIMAKLCAPARDSDIDHLTTLTLRNDPVDVFQGIMETLELLKLDMANFTIQQMRPHIQTQVVSYEKLKFKELLDTQKESGVDGLEFTKQWLQRAKQRIASSSASTSTSVGNYKYESGPTPSSICNEAFMEIFVWQTELNFPETLAMDEIRFNEIYVKCRKFLVVCSIVNTVYALVGESIRGLEELRLKLKQNILILLEDFMDMTFEEMMKHIGEQVIKETNEALVKHGKSKLSESSETTLKHLIVDLSSKRLLENTVYKLLFARYIEFLQNILTKRTQAPVKLPQGMSLVEKDLLEVTGQFLKLVTFNKNVFGNHYGEIIQSLSTDTTNGSAAASTSPAK